MVLLESLKLQPMQKMDSFKLKDCFSTLHHSKKLMGKTGLLIVFTCNHCPYAIAIWNRVIQFAPKFKKLGINVVAINPNINPAYPDDSVDKMIEKVKNDSITFPYLVDENQETANAYKAKCTPDLYLLNTSMELYYHGRFDDNWKDETKVNHYECFEAATQLSQEQPAPSNQFPSIGCSIKWL